MSAATQPPEGGDSLLPLRDADGELRGVLAADVNFRRLLAAD